MKKRIGVMFLVVTLLFLGLTKTKTYAAETTANNYDSYGTASFYGKYEQDNNGNQNDQQNGSEELPGYQGQGPIIPKTGDRNSSIYQVIGLLSLSLGTIVILINKKRQAASTTAHFNML